MPNPEVGGAKTTGVEIEGAVRPFRGFSITAGGTWLDATYQDFFTSGTIDNTGNRVQRQPRWAWRVTPAYEMEFGGFTPSLFATLQYTGDRFSDPENEQVLPNFYQLDAGVTVPFRDVGPVERPVGTERIGHGQVCSGKPSGIIVLRWRLLNRFPT